MKQLTMIFGFNSLMVRLKERAVVFSKRDFFCFNSLMVRLKVFEYLCSAMC